jgi:hypothetical protein
LLKGPNLTFLGSTLLYQYFLATTGVTGLVVSQAIGDAVASRITFSMQGFATQANITIVGANFMNATRS